LGFWKWSFTKTLTLIIISVDFFLQCHGTRPTDKDFETLYNLEKGDTLANIYKDFKTFEGDLVRILAFLNKEFGLNMVRKVIKHHETLSKEILEKILKTTITLGLFLYKALFGTEGSVGCLILSPYDFWIEFIYLAEFSSKRSNFLLVKANKN
jgi:hypothetical protein